MTVDPVDPVGVGAAGAFPAFLFPSHRSSHHAPSIRRRPEDFHASILDRPALASALDFLYEEGAEEGDLRVEVAEEEDGVGVLHLEGVGGEVHSFYRSQTDSPNQAGLQQARMTHGVHGMRTPGQNLEREIDEWRNLEASFLKKSGSVALALSRKPRKETEA